MIFLMPVLIAILAKHVKARRLLALLLLVLSLIPLAAGLLRTLPMYDYFDHYLMPPSRSMRLAECANASILVGLFSTLCCASILSFCLLTKLFIRKTKYGNQPPGKADRANGE
jgi:hypothetical protein